MTELRNNSPREIELRDAIARYAFLLRKSDKDNLRGDELDELLSTGVNMRRQARELGLTKKQLSAMLKSTVLLQTEQ